ncbi:SRPBCC domain-containing protein [Bdellovibrio bacteriovorus]|uniref:SRPBCC family protein n=1 Tax=Bdellovibrio bacteriovorus TaxID=959 RepID=UPI0035A92EA9
MANKTITLTRVFDAPKDVVWKTWTDPERMKIWWGPKNFTAPVIKNDLRIGGKYLNAMKDPDGKMYWSTGTYKDVRYLEKIVASDSFSDEKGNIVPASQYGMEGMRDELEITVLFEDQGDKTKLTLVHKDFPEGEMYDMCVQGWNESLDKFEAALKASKKPELEL